MEPAIVTSTLIATPSLFPHCILIFDTQPPPGLPRILNHIDICYCNVFVSKSQLEILRQR